MNQTLTIDPATIRRARHTKTGPNPMGVNKWKAVLGKGEWIPGYATEEALLECAPIVGNHAIVERLTGIAPTMMSRHPGRTSTTFGGEAYPAAAVAVAFLTLQRLGVKIPRTNLSHPCALH